jgi:hypothetical protein
MVDQKMQSDRPPPQEFGQAKDLKPLASGIFLWCRFMRRRIAHAAVVCAVSFPLLSSSASEISDMFDSLVSGTWSQRPNTEVYAPTDPPFYRASSVWPEVYFDEQICVVNNQDLLGYCRFAGQAVYGREWITLERVSEERAVTVDDYQYFEADYIGAYHHIHSLPSRLWFGYEEDERVSGRVQGWSIRKYVDLTYQLTGVVGYYPGSPYPLRISLAGEIEGNPPEDVVVHFTKVGLYYNGDFLSNPSDQFVFTRQFSLEKYSDGTIAPTGGSRDRWEPFPYFYRAVPENTGVINGRVFGRLSGLQATSGTVFVYGEDPEVALESTEIDSNGHFRVEGLPIMRTVADEGAPPGVGGAVFTVKIDDALASIPPEHQRMFGGPVVYFYPGQAEAVPFLPVELGLDAYAEPAIKRRLATDLSQLSKRHYKDAEEPVFGYINALVEDQITDAETEALRRGAWSERVLLEAGRDAEVMITDMIHAISSLLGNLWDDFFDRKSADLKKMAAVNKKAAEVKGAGSDSVELKTFLRFGLQEGQDGFEAALNEVLNETAHVNAAKIAGVVKGMFKALKVNLSLSFQEAGIEPTQAQKLGDVVLWGIDLTFRSLLAMIQSQTLSGTFKPFGGEVIKGAVNATAPMLFDNQPGEVLAVFPGSETLAGLFPSYTGITAEDLSDSVTAMMGWQTADQSKYEQDADIAFEALISIQNEFTTVKQRVDAAATFTNIADASADLAALADKIPILKAIFVLSKIVQYTSNVCGIVEPMRFTFAYLPDWVEYGVSGSFGKNPEKPTIGTSDNLCSSRIDGLMDIVEFFDDKANYLLHEQTAEQKKVVVSPIAPETAFNESIQDAGDRYEQALLNVATELSAGRLFPASTATGAPDGELALAEQAWVDRKTELSMRTSSVTSLAWLTVGELVTDQLISDLVELTLQSALRQEIADLVIDVILGDYTDPSEQDFIDRSESIVMTIERFISEIDSQRERLALIEAALPEIDSAIVIVSASAPVSQSTGASFVSTRGEEFVISARIRNIGSLPAQGISAALTSLSDEATVSLLTPSVVSIDGDVLEASDGVEGSGPDEVTVEWTVRYDADPGTYPVLFDLAVLENGGLPVTFETFDRTIELPIDLRATDTDSDGMSDEFERAYGLDTDLDDSADDPDDDSLTNFEEFANGTDPGLVDTDGDRIRDGDEAGTTFDPAVDDTSSLQVIAAHPEIYMDLVTSTEGIHPVLLIAGNESGECIVQVKIEATENLKDWEALDLTEVVVEGEAMTLVVPALESVKVLRIHGSLSGFEHYALGTGPGQADTDGDRISDVDEAGTTFDPIVDDTRSLQVIAAHPEIFLDLAPSSESVHPAILITRNESGDFTVKVEIEVSEDLKDWEALDLTDALVEGDTMTLVVPASGSARFLRIFGSKQGPTS